ncbi:hypothetical protein NFI96_002022 [Prochilodus magdalenae]|nr:hypothetical protein NFI96_002022 [Prochilodus magdalenae]
MEEYIQEAWSQGYIRPSTSPAAAGFFFVKKKDGGLRPCIGYRGLNSITKPYPYPLPLVPVALEQLRGATMFTKLDLRSAYNLVRIRKGDEWKTAFHTTRGHYEYRVMSFGLRNAPSVFQAFVNDVLRDMIGQFVIAYIDDILTNLGVGAVLSQRHGSPKKLYPIAFFSHKLSPAERNYGIGDRELLAMKLALEGWRHWLEGAQHPFLVLTDHNLEYLRSAKGLNPRQARWSLFFSRFDFKITFRPGSRNTKADSLSRIYDSEDTALPDPEPILDPKAVLALR